MTKRRILVVARQAGTANAFDSVRVELRRRGWTVHASALDQAQKLWAEPDALHLSTAGVIDRLNDLRPDVVLTGTSFDAEGDGAIWKAAAAAGISSVAYVDGWTNYAERFSAREPFDMLPDHVAVIDELARDELGESGYPGDTVVVGNVVFDNLLDIQPDLEGGGLMIVTEPVAPQRGFNELEVVESVLLAVEDLGGVIPTVIKPHPREQPDKYAELAGRFDFATVADEGADRLELMRRSRAAVGMTSMLLVEAAFVGLRCLSVQPTGAAYTSLISPARGIEVVESYDEVAPALRGALEERSGAVTSTTARPSAPRLADLIERTVVAADRVGG